MIDILRTSIEKVDNMQEQMGIVSTEIGILSRQGEEENKC